MSFLLFKNWLEVLSYVFLSPMNTTKILQSVAYKELILITQFLKLQYSDTLNFSNIFPLNRQENGAYNTVTHKRSI
jgi:hypothetical protein